ncbi:colicin import membrane protein [Variovorax sp. YR634]|uniref:TonB family protein n=1 Tax=Variovorax sp. YR634 TaxID=1884385 RepID=UPI000896AAED|nr:TonB family protein [Variovorax sp. YR634]SDY99911.1 colicin import membrane protein [Variovorax sp. YR634]
MALMIFLPGRLRTVDSCVTNEWSGVMVQREVHNEGVGRSAFRFAMRAGALISCVALLAACAEHPKAADDKTSIGPPVPPRLISDLNECKPSYPAESRRKEQQGRVEMRALVDVSGHVAQVELARSSGFPLLDEAARNYTKCLRFEPGQMGGRPGVMWSAVPMNFVLSAPRPPMGGWAGRIAAAIRQNIIYADPETIPGNPAVEFELALAPDGTIVGQTITKSSGFVDWDKAASVGITKTERLPLDVDGKVPPKMILTLRPKREGMQ